MHEILKSLRPQTLVLDVGCDDGSFPASATAATVVRVDRDAKAVPGLGGYFVCADAAALPFRDSAFHAVISNHSLEHFDDLAGALAEIGRVVKRDGAVFAAVPDASTLTDKIYRWLARGGGHVNAFTSPEQTADLIARATGLKFVATRTLCSSLSFLNRRNARTPPPRRLLLLGGGSEWSLFLYVGLSRRLDKVMGTRTSIYGWAFYFGNIRERIDTETWPNVCIRCGSGIAASKLAGRVRRSRWFVRVYECPACGAMNPYIPG